MFVSRFCAAVAGVMLLAPFFAYSGSLNSPAAPAGSSSAMYTLTDIYNRLDTGTATNKRAGVFTEPSAGLIGTATGKTLDDVMTLVNRHAPVAKTGQTGSYAAFLGTSTIPGGQDGALQKGATWPSPRFTDNNNGTVKDNLTGLIWLKNANAFGRRDWEQALSDCNGLAHNGTASLTDGSVAGDWRLPNLKELLSLMDYGRVAPALPFGHPFINLPPTLFPLPPTTSIPNPFYWSGTTYINDTLKAWYVLQEKGYMREATKTYTTYVWPVRGGR